MEIKTIQRYVDVLEAAFLIWLLPPFEAIVRKRIRKFPTIHLRNSGITHAMLGNHPRDAGHPRPRPLADSPAGRVAVEEFLRGPDHLPHPNPAGVLLAGKPETPRELALRPRI